MAFLTVFSKVLGLARDLVIAHFYGTGMEADAFNMAYLFTGNFFIIFGCIGGPFYSSVIAYLPKIKTGLWSFVKSIIFKSTVSLAFICFALYIFKAKILSGFIDSSTRPEYFQLTLTNIDLLLPVVLICGPAGILFAVLNCYKKYIEPSLAPAVINISLIASVFLVGDALFSIILALATSLGALLSLLFQMPSFLKIRKELIDTESNTVKIANSPYYEILFPALLSTGLSQIMVFIDSFFCKGLEEGAWTSVVLANRLIQMPLGVLLTAFLVPVFPRITELIAANDFKAVKGILKKAIGILVIVCLPAVLIGLFYSEEIIRLIFEHGAFDHRSTEMVSSLFFFLCFSIIPYALRDSFTRTLYSFGDSKTPLYVMLFAIVVKIILNYFLVGRYGLSGIAISTSVIALLNASLLFSSTVIKIKSRSDGL